MTDAPQRQAPSEERSHRRGARAATAIIVNVGTIARASERVQTARQTSRQATRQTYEKPYASAHRNSTMLLRSERKRSTRTSPAMPSPRSRRGPRRARRKEAEDEKKASRLTGRFSGADGAGALCRSEVAQHVGCAVAIGRELCPQLRIRRDGPKAETLPQRPRGVDRHQCERRDLDARASCSIATI